MSVSKTSRSLVASASNGAGSTTSGTQALSTALGILINAQVTNGGTGPTIGCTVNVYTSADGSTWRLFSSVAAGTTNSAVYNFPFLIPAEAMNVKVEFTGNTGQAVTVEAIGQELTSL
jgi:hypothetical protein